MAGHENPVRLQSPSDEGGAERRHLFLKILAIADLAPGSDSGPLSIDRGSFETVLERLAPHVTLEAPDRVGSGRTHLKCSFVFKELHNFHPDGIVEAQPVLRGLAEARDLLVQCLEQKLDMADIRGRVVESFSGTDLADRMGQAAQLEGPQKRGGERSSETDRGSDEVVESLLDQVDIPQSVSRGSTAADLVEMFSSVVAPSSKRVDRDRLESLVAEIDGRLSRQVAAIQEQPGFKNLESAWRGLKFLVDRLDFRAGILLEILPVDRAKFLEKFFDTVFHNEYEGSSDVSLNLVLADFAIGRSVPDLENLRNMSRLGESLGVPFVASMDPSFWGVRQAPLIGKLPDLQQKAQGSEYAKWNRFRKEPASMWVVLTANRFLLRPSWSQSTRPPKQFSWIAEKSGETPLWGSSTWAMGAALAQSFAEAGIKFPCVGPTSPGALDDLPVEIRSAGTGDEKASPLEIDLEDRRAFQLAQVGFAPLVSMVGSDTAFFNLVPSVHKPARYDDEEATRASFLSATVPFRAFAGAVAHELDRAGRQIGGGVGPDEISSRIQQQLLGVLAPLEDGEQDPESVQVEVEPSPDEPALLDVTVRLRPGFQIYGGPVDLIVGTTVPR